jgi:hypothetical protein
MVFVSTMPLHQEKLAANGRSVGREKVKNTRASPSPIASRRLCLLVASKDQFVRSVISCSKPLILLFRVVASDPVFFTRVYSLDSPSISVSPHECHGQAIPLPSFNTHHTFRLT